MFISLRNERHFFSDLLISLLNSCVWAVYLLNADWLVSETCITELENPPPPFSDCNNVTFIKSAVQCCMVYKAEFHIETVT